MFSDGGCFRWMFQVDFSDGVAWCSIQCDKLQVHPVQLENCTIVCAGESTDQQAPPSQNINVVLAIASNSSVNNSSVTHTKN